MQMLIKAFSVEPPQTGKTVTGRAAVPQDSLAFEAAYSWLSLSGSTETLAGENPRDFARLAQIESDLAETGVLITAEADELTVAFPAIEPEQPVTDGAAEEIRVEQNPALVPESAVSETVVHIDAARPDASVDWIGKGPETGRQDTAGAKQVPLVGGVHAKGDAMTTDAVPPADGAVILADAPRLRDHPQVAADRDTGEHEAPEAASKRPDHVKETMAEPLELKPLPASERGDRVQLSPALPAVTDELPRSKKTVTLPNGFPDGKASADANPSTALSDRARNTSDIPGKGADTDIKGSGSAVAPRPESALPSATVPESNMRRDAVTFRGEERAGTDGWIPGRSGLALPPAQGRGAEQAAFVPGAATPPKPGIELSAVREGSIEKADMMADGAALEFEEAAKTKHVERVRPEPAAARSIVNQVIQSVTRSHADGVVEIRLQPEELGRIRLTMVAGEAGMTVQISAERAETLDLVRRNIDMLENDLMDHGFEDLSFSFGGEDRHAQAEDRGSSAEPERTEESIAARGLRVTLADARPPDADGKLDIRV